VLAPAMPAPAAVTDTPTAAAERPTAAAASATATPAPPRCLLGRNAPPHPPESAPLEPELPLDPELSSCSPVQYQVRLAGL
jgi:hypothetical protein